MNLPKIPKHYAFKVTELLASNNRIGDLTIDNIRDVKFLDLRHNNLDNLEPEVLSALWKMEKVSLGGNPWRCECSTIKFFNSIKDMKLILTDYDEMFCHNIGKRFADLKSFEVCFPWLLLSICLTILATFGITIGIFYKYKKDIKIFLYAHELCLWFVSEDDLDDDKIYDAFVCFAANDQHLVEDIIEGLEKDGFHCLVGVRDWSPGEMFPELVRT